MIVEQRVDREFAHAASRTTSVFQSKFKSLLVRRGHKRSIVALAHKILRTLFFMIKRREHYRDSATDYEALSVRRNAPRWIKALTKFGFITRRQYLEHHDPARWRVPGSQPVGGRPSE